MRRAMLSALVALTVLSFVFAGSSSREDRKRPPSAFLSCSVSTARDLAIAGLAANGWSVAGENDYTTTLEKSRWDGAVNEILLSVMSVPNGTMISIRMVVRVDMPYGYSSRTEFTGDRKTWEALNDFIQSIKRRTDGGY